MINNIKTLNNALTRIGKSNVESVLKSVSEFAITQLSEHGNSTPFSIIYNRLNEVGAKPKGCTTTNLRTMLEASGLTFDIKTKIFSGKARLQTSADWWTQFQVESVEKTDEEKARASIKRALVLGYTAEQIADMAAEIEVEIAAAK
jgi:hypothetical protein